MPQQVVVRNRRNRKLVGLSSFSDIPFGRTFCRCAQQQQRQPDHRVAGPVAVRRPIVSTRCSGFFACWSCGPSRSSADSWRGFALLCRHAACAVATSTKRCTRALRWPPSSPATCWSARNRLVSDLPEHKLETQIGYGHIRMFGAAEPLPGHEL